jgi:lambda family phage portal protein
MSAPKFKSSLMGSAPYYGGLNDRSELALWHPSLNAADDETQDTTLLRARSRDLFRNNPAVKNAVRATISNTFGPRVKLSYSPDSYALGTDAAAMREWARLVEREFENYAHGSSRLVDARRQLTLTGLVHRVVAAAMIDGEAFGAIRAKPGARFATCVQLIDGDRISPPIDRATTYPHGVQKDPWGEIIAYFVRRAHPGAVLIEDQTKKYQWDRVPRSTANGRPVMIHVRSEPNARAEASRAVAETATILGQAKQLHRYQQSELNRAVLASTYAATISSEADYSTAMNVIGADTDRLQNEYGSVMAGLTLERMATAADFYKEGGLSINGSKVVHLLPGEKLDIVQPTGAPQTFAEFEKRVLHQLAAGLGVDYPTLTSDYQGLPYAAARLSLQGAHRNFAIIRENVTQEFCSKIFRAWLEEAILVGAVPVPPGVSDLTNSWDALTRCSWLAIGAPKIDPKKEIEADILALQHGLTTRAILAARDGLDLDELLQQRAEEEARMKELGLSAGPPLVPSDDPEDVDPEEEEERTA